MWINKLFQSSNLSYLFNYFIIFILLLILIIISHFYIYDKSNMILLYKHQK